jgi:hypothetical protein
VDVLPDRPLPLGHASKAAAVVDNDTHTANAEETDELRSFPAPGRRIAAWHLLIIVVYHTCPPSPRSDAIVRRVERSWPFCLFRVRSALSISIGA